MLTINQNDLRISKMPFFFLFSILFFCLITSCSKLPAPTPTPSPLPPTSTVTQISTSIPSTATPLQATKTPEPTATLSAEPEKMPDYDFSKIPGYLAVSDFSCNDQIAFCMNISMYNPDLKDLKRLTNHKDGLVFLMRWSPDNRYIAYEALVTGESGGTQLRLYDFKTHQTILLTPKFISEVTSISWSPDSRHFAVGFVDGHIQVMDAVSHEFSTLVKETKMTDIYVAWSPDGKTIAYSSYNNSGGKISSGLFTVSSKGGNPVSVEPSGFLPSWSPDGKQLAYFCHQNDQETSLCLEDINADGTGSGVHDFVGLPKTDTFITPAWSPNGKFLSLFAGTKDQIFADVIDFSNKKIISTQKKSGAYGQPSWSPDSKGLVFIDRHEEIYHTIYLVVFDGEKFFTVNTEVDFADVLWSPSAKLP